MGILKTAAKVAGTAVLATTGAASAILQGVSDTTGIELASKMFFAAKQSSFNGIRNMWSNGDEERETLLDGISDHVDEISHIAAQKKLADAAYSAAQIAKENGDMERYEEYMEKYHNYGGR